MKYTNSLLLTIVSILCSFSASAHALWIESNPLAVKNKAHDVKIYYGEYATNEIEPIDKWYSDVKDFKIVLTTPGQQKMELTKEASADYFTSSFIPEEDGIYILSVVHSAKDLGGTTKYEFSSVALVTVGQTTTALLNLPFCVQIQPKVFQSGQVIDALILQNGKPVPDAELLVMSQEGWSKTFKADAEGKVRFPGIWKGKYVLEASLSKDEGGQWHDKSYKRTWQGATTSLQVK